MWFTAKFTIYLLNFIFYVFFKIFKMYANMQEDIIFMFHLISRIYTKSKQNKQTNIVQCSE